LLRKEGMSCLLHLRERTWDLQGIYNRCHGPAISHLLFADDSIFFTRSDQCSMDALQLI
jgi:hypothetical protein